MLNNTDSTDMCAELPVVCWSLLRVDVLVLMLLWSLSNRPCSVGRFHRAVLVLYCLAESSMDL